MCSQEVLLGPIVFSQADQDVVGAEVLVPGRVEDAVSCSEDPLITDQTGSTQQLLRAALVEHHLPANTNIFTSYIISSYWSSCLFQMLPWLPWSRGHLSVIASNDATFSI